METYIIIVKIDSQWGFAVWLRKFKQGSVSIYRDGMGWEMGGRFKWEGIYIYIYIYIYVYMQYMYICNINKSIYIYIYIPMADSC